eukprot:GHVH01011047.1.p1 GENE.GHVH01011047.1~~GHVH01011047.1.p1  ORF type:complete len:452 (+),score=73.42 GHVH01011047.1:85-1440(+)
MSNDKHVKEEMERFGEVIPGMYDNTIGILEQPQSWDKMSSRYGLTKDDIESLTELSAMPIVLVEKYQILKKDGVFLMMLRIFNSFDQSESNSYQDKVGWLIVLLHEVLREDMFRFEKLLECAGSGSEYLVHDSLLHALKQISKAPHLADRLAALATGFLAHDNKSRFGPVESLAILMIDRKTKCTSGGVLAAIANLLKVPRFRPHLWNISGVHVLIRASLSSTKSDPIAQYQAILCTWLFSFSQKFIVHIVESGILVKLLHLLKSTPRKEKIVRLGVEVVANSVDCLDAVQIMLDEKLGDTLDLLLFEKWRSEDLYTRIEDVNSMYLRKIREWSTFERYCKELDTGRLSPGYLHEDQFWADNVMQFEEKEFLAIRKLITLLRSNDASTLALTCHDLGEFARLHPVGKKALAKLHARDMLLALMNHQDRDVERESLLAIQKIMLDQWEVAGQ